jgi:RNA polymerase subunit RPABC4/transcription elongation factor Spt4
MAFNLDALSDYVLLIVAFLGAFVSALWLSLIIWTFRDMRARSRDIFAQILAAAVVAVLTVPGLIIYLILRPPKTLAETYEQSLEEEALLQEIEEKRVCPGCGRQADEDWRICPNCMTKLKKPCAKCGQLMDLPWNVCPYCATPVEGMRSNDGAESPEAIISSGSAAGQ